MAEPQEEDEDEGESFDHRRTLECAKTCLQTLCNACAGNATNQRLVWRSLRPRLSQVVVSMLQLGDRKGLAPAVALIYTCTAAPETTGGEGPSPFAELLADKVCMSALMRCAVPRLQGTGQGTGVREHEEQEQDPVADWISVFVGKAVDERCVSVLWRNLSAGSAASPTDDEDEGSLRIVVTAEQLVLLHFIESVLEGKLASLQAQGSGVDGREGATVEAGALTDACVALVHILEEFPQSQRMPAGASGVSTDASAHMHFVMNEEGRSVILRLLAGVLSHQPSADPGNDGDGETPPSSEAQEGRSTHSIKGALAKHGLLELLVSLLADSGKASGSLEALERDNGLQQRPGPRAAPVKQVGSDGLILGRKVLLLRLVANFTHLHKENQDKVSCLCLL